MNSRPVKGVRVKKKILCYEVMLVFKCGVRVVPVVCLFVCVGYLFEAGPLGIWMLSSLGMALDIVFDPT